MYDRELAAVAHEHRLKAAKSLGMPAIYRLWEPSGREIELLRRNPRRRKLIENTTIGENVVERNIFLLIGFSRLVCGCGMVC